MRMAKVIRQAQQAGIGAGPLPCRSTPFYTNQGWWVLNAESWTYFDSAANRLTHAEGESLTPRRLQGQA